MLSQKMGANDQGVERVFGAAGKSTGAPAENKAQRVQRTKAALVLVGLAAAAHTRQGHVEKVAELKR